MRTSDFFVLERAFETMRPPDLCSPFMLLYMVWTCPSGWTIDYGPPLSLKSLTKDCFPPPDPRP